MTMPQYKTKHKPQMANRQIRNLRFAILAMSLLVGCTSSPTAAPASPAPVYTPIPTPTPTPEPPSPGATAAVFLDAWQAGDFGAMYARLSPASQAAVDAEGFTQRYRNALHTATVPASPTS
jgi:hypothetical protein